jgi:Ca2+-binding RTX toxin-like protein
MLWQRLAERKFLLPDDDWRVIMALVLGTPGNDNLFGTAGIDFFYGYAGNDTYVVDDTSELVFENPGEGAIDWVFSTASFYLYANIEALSLQSGAGSIFGVGNELDNTIEGNEGDNLLIAGAGHDFVLGGFGVDAIYGQDGNDILQGGGGIDYIAAGLGNDTVYGGLDPDEVYGEAGNDTLYGSAIGGDDNFATDILVGGDGEDQIHGDSGLGDYDRLYGNLGSDTFYVDTPDDLVFEQPGEGINDTVVAKIDGAGFYLYAEIENLILQGNTPFGVGNDLANVLSGSAAANWLLGGAGNDTLDGYGGNDVLFGEAGADVFSFVQSFLPGSGADIIGDFEPGIDKIRFNPADYADFAQVQAHFVQDGADGAIVSGTGDVVVLQGVTMATLTATDFIFG